MPPFALALLAAAPLAAVGALILIARWPATRVMPLGYCLTAMLALGVWQTPWNQTLAATVKGAVVGVELLYIVFGAVLLLKSLEQTNAMEGIKHTIQRVSPDRRVQAIIIGWLFGAFIEGASGFGTPAALAVPILIGMRFPPLCAAFIGVAIQCTPVSFGAAGTPILIGVSSGLQGLDAAEVAGYVAHTGAEGGLWGAFLHLVGYRVALIHAALGTLTPLLILCLMTRFFGEHKTVREGLAVWPFALFAGLSMTVPYLLAAKFLGPEFPSLIGGGVGLVLVVSCSSLGFLMPPEEKVWLFPTDRSTEAKGVLGMTDPQTTGRVSSLHILSAWAPYAVIASLLLVTRVVEPIKRLASETLAFRIPSHFDAAVGSSGLLGTDIGEVIRPLYLPGSIFIVVSVGCIAMAKLTRRGGEARHGTAWSESLLTIGPAGIALVCSVALVQVFVHSGHGANGYASMPLALAEGCAGVLGPIWACVAPLIGGVGAAVAGSNTLSNMMFAMFQFKAGQSLGIDPVWAVALQAVGGAAGNTVSVHNIVAASAVAGLHGQEGEIMRKTGIVFLYYALTPGIIFWLVSTGGFG